MKTVATNVEIADDRGYTQTYVKLPNGKSYWLGSGTLENKHIINVKLNLGETK